ncbi:MAG: L-seryl-tRNA(Sec) selenium transferase [Armatimonadota bacterium]|nr:L-seryl-tRNA(Sec) selenium transferase [Armatimonadota bacterium]MDR7453376.1 L-seryl-tRNA(Sec) selenium transferase [Armatimonadota bacterium]MDR7457195.1 L-seryl-tRNA(Sec) selenium transferase [Armatimonadota bacterium]MDR7496064.1 L-seryl-tRNA(Sec) selenium transferase [Armatimonadota bacterium]
MNGSAALRRLPSVDRLLRALEARGTVAAFSRRAVAACVREVLTAARAHVRAAGVEVGEAALLGEVETLLERRLGGTLRPAINATGIILHTNLGRAPLGVGARAAVEAAAAGYSTLEIDLETGERGSRHAHLEGLLTAVTGAEAGIAVNNAAAAVTLSLAALAPGAAVAVSRGELVEIGGSFRLPEVMAQSGARLAEVGTTNRTYLADYEAALDAGAAALLKVHRSNFIQRGFVHDVPLAELVALGRRRGVSVVYDLGGGCLVDLRAVGLPAEPTVQEAVAAGADLVLFSGDKLLGGPQAGVVVGRRNPVDRCRSHPLARALRLDKLDVAALAATLRAYLDPDRAWAEIPVLALLRRPPAVRRRLARRLARAAAAALGSNAVVDVVATEGEMGGGTLPGAVIASSAVRIRPTRERPEAWAARLRRGTPPVIGLVRDRALLLDVLALLPGENTQLARALRSLARDA